MKRQRDKLERQKIERKRPERTKRRPRLKRGQSYGRFDTLFDGDDLGDGIADTAGYTGDLETDSQEEVSEALQRVIDHRKSMREVWRVMVDTEFWVAVCFQSREQKNEFLEKAGLKDLGDKYLDGLIVAERLGVEVEPIVLEVRKPDKPPRGLRDKKHFLTKGGDG